MTPGGDEYRLRAIEQRLDVVDHTVRALGPAVGQVAGHEIEIEAAQEAIRDLRVLTRDQELSVQARFRELEAGVKSGPVETLKLILIVVTVFSTGTGAILLIAKAFT